jgi:hypothetical protein
MIADVIKITEIVVKNSRRPAACKSAKVPELIE